MVQYRIDSRRVTLSEFRTELLLPAALFAWSITRLPLRIPGSSEYPTTESWRACVVPATQVPGEAVQAFEAPTAELVERGFRGRVFHVADDPAQQSSHCQADFIDRSGQIVAVIKRRVFRGTTPHKTFLITELISQAPDGTFLVTSSSPGDLQLPVSVVADFRPKATIDELCQAHARRLHELRIAGRCTTAGNATAVVELLEDLHRRIHEHQVARGVFVAIPPETDSSAAAAPTAAMAAAGPHNDPSPPADEAGAPETVDAENSQLLAEVRRREAGRAASPLNAVLLLLVSGAAFLALGGIAWSWSFALLLVPILLFHELGHWTCMKMFDYRNVKMFFIPLFGAAVSGRNYNVPGWKRVVTSLMGPLPGIALGIALGIVGLVRGYELLVHGALIMLIVNGFNLIPALPLDGGWVVHGLLFSRHAFLDLLFRAAAIGFLFLVGAVGGGWLLFGVGIAMAASLPTAFQTARITDRLRSQHWPAATDAGHIPPAAVAHIAQELDQAYPKGLALKTKAALVAQIFQNVCSPPPGILSSLALGAVYLGSLVAAVIGIGVIALGQQADLGEFIAQAAAGPKLSVDSTTIERQPAGGSPVDLVSKKSLVATFADHAAAESAFAQFRTELAPDRRMVLFGSTLLVPLEEGDTPQQQDAWFDRLEALTGPPSLESDGGTSVVGPVHVELLCILPNPAAAEKAEQAVAGYLAAAGGQKLVPPWDPQATITPEQLLARSTVAAMLKLPEPADGDGDIKIYEQMSEAQRRGRADDVQRLRAELGNRHTQRLKAHLQQLRDSGQYDAEILDAYASDLPPPVDQWTTDNLPINRWKEKVAARLGKYDEPQASRAEAFGARYGHARRNGLMLEIFASFGSPPSALLAIVDWLEAQGCSDIRYRISSGEIE